MKTFLSRLALLVSVGAACLQPSAWAQTETKPAPPAAISPEKEALIQRLLDLTGSANLGKQMMDGMIDSLRRGGSSVPDQFWETFRNEVDMNEINRLVIPIYDKHLSEEDLKGLIAFYGSPLGRRVMGKMPEILRESMEVGQEWGLKIGTRAMERIEQEKAKAKADPSGDGDER